MNAKTLQALQDNIAHWKRMRADRHGCNETPNANCPLCALFTKGFICEGCPVAKETGRWQCCGTPYYKARDAWHRPDEAAWQQAATAEIKFLQSLLPKPRRKPRRLTLTKTRNQKLSRKWLV